jgi:polyisoprenoid-binding protein YceI
VPGWHGGHGGNRLGQSHGDDRHGLDRHTAGLAESARQGGKPRESSLRDTRSSDHCLVVAKKHSASLGREHVTYRFGRGRCDGTAPETGATGLLLDCTMTLGHTDDTEIATPRPGRYELDLARSKVEFTTKHLFVLPVRGTFSLKSGVADVAEPVTESRVEAEIDATSFRTPTPLRDRIVRSAMFLDTSRYPTITFRSMQWDGETLTGLLTVRETTKPVTVRVTESSTDGDSFTAHATAHVDRTEFGVTASPGMLDRHLDFTLTVRFVRR